MDDKDFGKAIGSCLICGLEKEFSVLVDPSLIKDGSYHGVCFSCRDAANLEKSESLEVREYVAAIAWGQNIEQLVKAMQSAQHHMELDHFLTMLKAGLKEIDFLAGRILADVYPHVAKMPDGGKSDNG